MSDQSDQIHAGQVVKSVSIENLVNQRAAVLERIQKGTALLLEANQIAAAAGLGFPTVCMSTGYSRNIEHRLTGQYRDDDPERFLEIARTAVDAGAWQHLMSESGLRTLMDAKGREEWDKQFDGPYQHPSKPVPELTLDSIRRTFASLYHARAEMFDRGVLEVFRRLSWDYKTNQPFKFGKRIILEWIRAKVTGGERSLGYPSSGKCDQLDDLVRVFSVLDGKPEPDHRNGFYSLLSRQDNVDSPVIQTPYFELKTFRNGNGHLTFTRPDLVEKMNAILTRHHPGALPHAKS